MENQAIKRLSVINGALKEAGNTMTPTFSQGDLFRVLNIRAATLKKWIKTGKVLPDWALQRLSIKKNNSGWIRTKDGERHITTFLENIAYGCDSISVKIRRDGTPMDIPANLVPDYSPPKYSLGQILARANERFSVPSESFLSDLTAVGREDKKEMHLK